MARGGGTGSRNKKKKATEAGTTTPNGVDTSQKITSDSGDKNKNIKHRKQKEDTPPVVAPQQPEDDQPQKESQNKLVPTSEQLRLAQITQSADTNKDPQRKAKITQIMEITGKSEDEVATALFDCNWDETKAIELLLEEGGGLGGWEETGKKKTKKSDKDEASRENEDFNDDFDPTNLSDNRERSRNRGPPRLRNRGGSSVHAGRGDSDWKMRENQENERNFEGGRGRGGRGLGPRSRGGGHVGLATRQRGRGGPRGAGGPRTDFVERGGAPAEGLGQIDTWNPIGSEKQEKQDQRLRHNKDAFENAGNWGDDFPDTKVFTASGSSAKAVGEPVNGSAAHAAPGGPAGSAPANNSLSYSQPIDLSSLLKTGGLGQYNAAASQDLKSAIGIGGGKSGGDYSGGPSLSYSSGSSPYNTAGSNVQLSSVPGSAFSPIKPAAVTNGSGDRGKALPRARLPPPSRIPSSAVEMPGAGGQDSGLSSLDVQFGGMDLQFGGSGSGGGEAAVSGLDFNAAPGQSGPVKESHGLDNKYGHSGHSITSSVGDRKPEDSYKSASSLAPGSVKEVNQSLSSALSAAGIKPSGGSGDSVPGYVRPGVGSSQRSPGPMITKSDTLGYNSQAYYQGDRQSGSGKSNYNSYGGQGGYDRQNSSGYSGSNGLNSSYPGQGTGGGGSYGSGQNNSNYSSSGYNSSQANNFSSSGNYSSFSSSTGHSGNSYSSKSGGSASTTSGYNLPSATTGSGFEVSATTTASKSSYETATVSAGAAGTGLGLSSVSSSSSKMSVNSGSGNKLVPGMPPGVANVLPAQYMIGANTPAGFPAYLAAGLGQPAAAMYGYSGHQLEDLAALQRSTLAASLPQLVSNSGHNQHSNTKGPSSGYYDPSSQFGGGSAVPSTLASRQADNSGSSFGGGGDTKFAGGAPAGVSDSTSSPVPSTVGNTVGQPTPFNLASTFTAAQHPTLPPGYAYFYGGVGGMPGLQYGGGVAGGGVYPPTHPGIPVPTAAGQTSTTQFQNKAYGSSYGTSYDSLSLGQSSSGYVNKNYGSDNNQAKTGSSNNTAGTAGYWSSALW